MPNDSGRTITRWPFDHRASGGRIIAQAAGGATISRMTPKRPDPTLHRRWLAPDSWN